MKTFKVASVHEAGENLKKIGTEKFIFIEGPKGGNYMFARNQKGDTIYVTGNSKNSQPPIEAIALAQSQSL